MVTALCTHKLGFDRREPNTDTKRLMLMHFKKRPFKDTDEMLGMETELTAAYDYESATIDDIITSALLFAALYGAIYGKWHEEYLKKCIMELKKFYINLQA